MAKRNSVESSSQLEFKKNYGTAFDDEVKYITSYFEIAIDIKTIIIGHVFIQTN